ncbi:MAG: hypothetical protein J6X94_00270 [Lachnospiraceae bacterium]|nr:hypothetical protein [Lachnospiraceae bacterium]
MASIITVGRSVYNYNSVSGLLKAPKENAAVFLFLFFPILLILALCGKAIYKNEEKEVFSNDEIPGIYKAFPVISFILTAASSALALLSYFPGILGYDSEWQTLQAFGILPLSNHHPVLHTLIWNFFVALEWWGVPHPYGLVIYCIFQILIVSLVCAFVVRCEIREGCRWFLPVITILFYALYPAFGVFSVQMTKDVLFGSAVILLILNLLKAGRGEKANPFLIFLFTVLSSLLRNNFLPAGCVLVIVLFFMRKDKMMRKALIESLAGVIVSLSVMAFVYPACGVERSESHESLSVPINQIAAVYVHRYSELTLPEKFIIEGYMSAGAYNPRLADTVKFSFNDELYDSDRSAFWDLYLHLLRKYPHEFIDAFLTQNVQLWYPGASVTDRYSAREYIETDNVLVYEYTVSCTPVIPEMKGFYDMIIEEIEQGRAVSGLPFSLSIPFIVLMVALYMSVKARHKGFTAAVLLSGALWATYLLGPVSAFRYMYPFFMLVPVMVIPVFSRKKKPEKSQEPEEKEERKGSDTVIDLD